MNITMDIDGYAWRDLRRAAIRAGVQPEVMATWLVYRSLGRAPVEPCGHRWCRVRCAQQAVIER